MAKKSKDSKEARNIQLRSDEVQEILSRPPAWIVRWGTTLIVALIAVLLLGSWFFKYPDIVHSKIVVTTENPPAPIVARANGNIEHLFVQEREKVEKDQALAVIQNTAYYKDVLKLEERLREMASDSMEAIVYSDIAGENYQLGNIQPIHATFLKKMDDYRHFLELDYHQQKIESLKEELNKYEDRYARLQRQKKLTKKEFNLVKKQFTRDSALYEKEFIPEAEFEKSESRLIRKKYELEQSEISLSNTRIEISKIEQEILDLQLEYRQQKNQLKVALAESFDNLQTAIKQWKHDFYLDSPIDGTVTFTKYWSENQSVKKGERVMTVIPRNQGEMIGKLTLSFKGAGKVKKGQEVNIKFSNYPYLEYGMVRGIVRSISLVPENQNYIVEVSLPDSLTTFYGKTLSFTQQMQGSAEIITEDKRLLEQILRPIQYVFTKNFAAGGQPKPRVDDTLKQASRQDLISKARNNNAGTTSSNTQRQQTGEKPSANRSPSHQPTAKQLSTEQSAASSDPSAKMDNNKGDASLDGSSLGPGREDTRYYLIGGSFRNKDNAEDFRNKLAEKGYDSEVLHEPDGLHKVTYQTCNSLKKAKAALEELEQEGINSWIYQPPEKE